MCYFSSYKQKQSVGDIPVKSNLKKCNEKWDLRITQSSLKHLALILHKLSPLKKFKKQD